jgi:hypothetical protein
MVQTLFLLRNGRGTRAFRQKILVERSPDYKSSKDLVPPLAGSK